MLRILNVLWISKGSCGVWCYWPSCSMCVSEAKSMFLFEQCLKELECLLFPCRYLTQGQLWSIILWLKAFHLWPSCLSLFFFQYLLLNYLMYYFFALSNRLVCFSSSRKYNYFFLQTKWLYWGFLVCSKSWYVDKQDFDNDTLVSQRINMELIIKNYLIPQ